MTFHMARLFDLVLRSTATARAALAGFALAAASMALLPGCATISSASSSLGSAVSLAPKLQVGMAEAEVLQRMGSPTSRYNLPDGQSRLEFAKGPYGVVTYMVDLDASGRLTVWNQVLDSIYFAKVKKGMDRDAVLLLVGRPGTRQTEAQGREAWYWRFAGYECPRYAITFDSRGRVLGPPEVLPDPACNAPAV